MGVPSSEVSYSSATNGRGEPEVHKGHVVLYLECFPFISLLHSSENITLVRSKGYGRNDGILSSDVVRTAHIVTRHNKPIHNILSTALQLSVSHKALGTLPEESNVMPKHVGATIHN
jgi:hypothetical protein